MPRGDAFRGSDVNYGETSDSRELAGVKGRTNATGYVTLVHRIVEKYRRYKRAYPTRLSRMLRAGERFYSEQRRIGKRGNNGEYLRALTSLTRRAGPGDKGI